MGIVNYLKKLLVLILRQLEPGIFGFSQEARNNVNLKYLPIFNKAVDGHIKFWYF